ncbi:MAG: Y-family DNA polymerase [Tepidisphaerales bacterium]
MLVRSTASRQTVVFAGRAARRRGIVPGMSLANARAVWPEVGVWEADEAGDERGLRAIARWMLRYSPVVALEGTDAVLVDLTGTQRCLGSPAEVMSRVEVEVGRWGLTVRLAVAPTGGAAWAIATAGRHGSVVGSAELEEALRPLPVSALRIDASAADALHRLGVTTVGALLRLPRETLPARFGAGLLARLDRVLGRVPEVWATVKPEAALRESVRFEEPTTSLETLHAAMEMLCERLTAGLRLRGRGARRLRLWLHRAYGGPVEREVWLASASREVKRWMELLRHATESLPTGGEATGDEGFIAVELLVEREEVLSDRQTDYLGLEASVTEEAWSRLMESLTVRLGGGDAGRGGGEVDAGRVVRPRLRESYVPERSVGYGESDEATERRSDGGGRGGMGGWFGRRPVRVFDPPREVRVMVAPNDDREGRPVAVFVGEEVLRITHAAGPQRVGGEWWRGHFRTRDYFDAHEESGRRLWLFRVLETGRWFWQGEY